MKLLTTIFAFYILALSTIPCCVFDNCPEDQIETTYLTSEHESGDDDGCGTCSPFFNCGSCTVGFANTVKLIEISKEPLHNRISIKHISFNQSLHSSPFGAIWQPPKLS